ncbi:MAG: hypothetical protein IPM82_11080 [Saprospiraceae bacterium]|nr:hypothetical protein [Saprospiraceae bacterium]
MKGGSFGQPLKKDVEMVLSELDANGKVVFQHIGSEATIDILQEEGVENKVPFKLEIRNNASKARHCALFFGSSNYRLIKAYNDEIPANSTVNALHGQFQTEQRPAGNQYLEIDSEQQAHPPRIAGTAKHLQAGRNLVFLEKQGPARRQGRPAWEHPQH